MSGMTLIRGIKVACGSPSGNSSVPILLYFAQSPLPPPLPRMCMMWVSRIDNVSNQVLLAIVEITSEVQLIMPSCGEE